MCAGRHLCIAVATDAGRVSSIVDCVGSTQVRCLAVVGVEMSAFKLAFAEAGWHQAACLHMTTAANVAVRVQQLGMTMSAGK